MAFSIKLIQYAPIEVNHLPFDAILDKAREMATIDASLPQMPGKGVVVKAKYNSPELRSSLDFSLPQYLKGEFGYGCCWFRPDDEGDVSKLREWYARATQS